MRELQSVFLNAEDTEKFDGREVGEGQGNGRPPKPRLKQSLHDGRGRGGAVFIDFF